MLLELFPNILPSPVPNSIPSVPRRPVPRERFPTSQERTLRVLLGFSSQKCIDPQMVKAETANVVGKVTFSNVFPECLTQ